MTINIAIDGPSGAGKSTIAKRISKERQIAYLDTGAMYRAVGYFVVSHGVDPADAESVIKLLPLIEMEIIYKGAEQFVIVSGVNVTAYLREHAISMAASTVSKIPEVRLKLVELQRKIAANSDCVLDGRDIGTYVLPNANYKFFITASPEERARRRFLELSEKGQSVPYEQVLEDIVKRDEQDTNRVFAPLKAAEDAIVIDTTGLGTDAAQKVVDGYLWKL